MSLFLRRRILTGGFGPLIATGGTVIDVTISGVLYRIHVFTTVGSSQAFEVQSLGTTDGLVEYLVIGGGANGGGTSSGQNVLGGGGGAGGYRSSVVGETSGTGCAAEPRLEVAVGVVPVTVGPRGNRADLAVAEPSSLGPISSLAGGAGGSQFSPSGNAGNGGSGGGAGWGQFSGVTVAAGSGTACQGGNGRRIVGRGAGGGGASGNATSANGANGLQSNITGVPTFRAGGGGGSAGGSGGAGGGGNAGATTSPGQSATPNTGSGGGGGGRTNAGGTPGQGASGIVIVRYPLQPV